MKILLSGACGHMGAEIIRLASEGYRGAAITAGVDPFRAEGLPFPCAANFDRAETDVDCIVDFSNRANTYALLDFAVRNHLPLVIATTGQTEDERAAIADASRNIPIFFAANFSLGVVLLIDLAKRTAATFPDAEIEIIEKHHDRKLDAPSGTALAIADAIRSVRPLAWVLNGRSGRSKRTREEIGIHAVRMGNIVGEHEVIIGTPNQTITLTHTAHCRSIFAEGALSAAAFLKDQSPGLYDMQSLLSNA